MTLLITLMWLPLFLVAVYFVITFNRLVSRRNAGTNARASIDVNLTRRHNLIPNLVAAVRGYAEHEHSTLRDVANARQNAIAQLGTSGSAAAELQVEQSLARMTLRVENYPDLKADEIFSQLMRNLTEAEEQISASRRAFNGQVLRLNNMVQQFPTLVVANICGFRTLEPYSAAASETAAPAVALGQKVTNDG